MTSFFIPGIGGDAHAIESVYGEMRLRIQNDLGRRPSPRRIASLWTRREGVDCITQVGRRDPMRDGTVIAIFDMGPHQPFVVWWQPEPGGADGVREVLGCNAYSVLEFDA